MPVGWAKPSLARSGRTSKGREDGQKVGIGLVLNADGLSID